ncbi:unnamed protein product [Zymoseptoria tritici ST99CH_1A5]|uniref:DUF8035 domain-containing protein n=1 Tax=Zymoseptoria tritici ST99CH_1A5 TaxID=1276529 RepID=A0A1Y6LFW9_ZYMTR|nr:unnamed protein product [Zymoseptoria tritici ST99CH_1A5]
MPGERKIFGFLASVVAQTLAARSATNDVRLEAISFGLATSAQGTERTGGLSDLSIIRVRVVVVIAVVEQTSLVLPSLYHCTLGTHVTYRIHQHNPGPEIPAHERHTNHATVPLLLLLNFYHTTTTTTISTSSSATFLSILSPRWPLSAHSPVDCPLSTTRAPPANTHAGPNFGKHFSKPNISSEYPCFTALRQKVTTYIARPRTTPLAIHLPRVKPIAEVTMSYNHRPLSPGGRRIANPNRLSDNSLDPNYYTSRHSTYASPRASTGVIPISTQTFINVPPPQAARPVSTYDSYSGRPRRSSLVDGQRGTTTTTTHLPSRTRPNIVQTEVIRPASPVKTSREKDYYITPAISQEPARTVTHKKLYSVDDNGARLVADVNLPVPAGGERNHKRRNSVDRSGYRSSGVSERERDRGRRGYHANGTSNKPRDTSIDDEDAYSYTDPASMYRDTEPRWREPRPRRGSVDRNGGTSRERPVSVLDPTFGIRPAAKEVGPPPSTRGWDKINDNLGRTRSVRDEPRQVAQSPTRGRGYADPVYLDPKAGYHAPARATSSDRRTTVHQYDYSGADDREPRRERRPSVTRDARLDQSVERRGFGIRPEVRHQRPESQVRYAGDGRGSEEPFEAQKYRDSGYGDPHRRDTAPELYHDMRRLEQEKKDRELAGRVQADERDRHRERDLQREVREKESRRRDEDRGHDRDQDRKKDREVDQDRERERERARQMEPPAERDRDRHRRDTDRDRDHARKENSPRQSTEQISKPSLSQAATGGLAGAAAAFGLTGLLNKVADKRDKDKDRDRDDPDRDRDRNEKDRERGERRDKDGRSERREKEERSDRRNGDDRRNGEERDFPPRERRSGKAASDEELRERESERDRYRDPDRSLGFAFENAGEPPRSAPPVSNPDWKPDNMKEDRSEKSFPPQERSFDNGLETQPPERVPDRGQRDHQREQENKPAEVPASTIDADEDYRRRMEQVQRELGVSRDHGRGSDDQRGSDSDPDRARRRREREQRHRARESRGSPSTAAVANSMFNETPPPSALRNSFDRDDQSTVTASSTVTSSLPSELRRRPSILDMPMMDEPFQIIDNSESSKRENRVRIVDPPTEEEERRPKGILKKPTAKFPENSDNIREGVAPLKDATKKGIPPGARWTKIDRRLVNPEALEAAQERFEERLDCVIVLRVLTKEEIQKLADRTASIRDSRHEEDRAERKSSRRTRDRRDRDEYEDPNSEDEFKAKTPKMLEGPSTGGSAASTVGGASDADFRERRRERDREREREREPEYALPGSMPGGWDRDRERSKRDDGY